MASEIPEQPPASAQIRQAPPVPGRSVQGQLVKPSWLKVKAPGSSDYLKTRDIVKTQKATHTVCEEAHCPNIGECWSHHTATFMIMGALHQTLPFLRGEKR